MKTLHTSRIIHQIAYCNQCNWYKEWGGEGETLPRISGYAHAKKTGHTVSVETGTTYNINFQH